MSDTLDFISRLRDLAGRMKHSELADRLGIERSLLRNWLYRDRPSKWAVASLSKKVHMLWKKRNGKS